MRDMISEKIEWIIVSKSKIKISQSYVSKYTYWNDKIKHSRGLPVFRGLAAALLISTYWSENKNKKRKERMTFADMFILPAGMVAQRRPSRNILGHYISYSSVAGV